MTTRRSPVLFISHGSPAAILEENEYSRALTSLGQGLAKPAAIVVMSAHGITPDGTVEITSGEKPQLIYDFGGFPDELYRMKWPAPGSPGLSARIAALLKPVVPRVIESPTRGWDHGVWVPLKRVFPAADIPVVEVTMPYPSSPETVLAIGRALKPLRDENVLLIGSGSATHNLRDLRWDDAGSEVASWAGEFNAWLEDKVEKRDLASLVQFEKLAPHARHAHPDADHFYPVFFTLGALDENDAIVTLTREVQYGTLSMYTFVGEARNVA